MFCSQCGIDNLNDAKFCVKCGHDLSRQTPPERKHGRDSLDIVETNINHEILADSLAKGSLFANRYEILDDGQRGGMGSVYKCRDTELSETVAVKIIHPHLLSSPTALSRFRQEVAISRKLHHQNIVDVHDLAEVDGIKYFTMDWVEGLTLREIIEQRKKRGEPFTIKEAHIIISQLAGALEYAHAFTVHRDIKPENILIEGGAGDQGLGVSEKTRIKLTDFGIAKMLSPSQFTSTSIQMGTPYYMAPEQKDDAATVDGRADVYAMGVILFELLTLENTIGPEVPSEFNADIPLGIDDVYRQSVATRVDNRYKDPQSLSGALSEVMASAEHENVKKAEERKKWEEDERRRKEANVRQEAEAKRLEEVERKIAKEKHDSEMMKAEEAEQEEYAKKLVRDRDEHEEQKALAKRIASEKKINNSFMWILPFIVLAWLGFYMYNDLQEERMKNRVAEFMKQIGDEMVKVKGGCYQMGDQFGDGESEEKPVHEVCVDDFKIGKYEVTQGQWKGIMGSNPSTFKNCGDNCPVEQVSWDDVQTYIKKLNHKTGKRYRLPTEAEWEYAARSGGKKEKYAGFSSDSELSKYVNYCDKSCEFDWKLKNHDDGYKNTSPVGKYRPNVLGIYDMSGNVYEWVNDLYDNDYYKNSPRNNPKGSDSGGRVLRGGSWTDDPVLVRSSSRYWATQDSRNYHIGFRVALPPQD